MPTARKELVCLDATPYYHVVSRCVRRAFLCGVDSVTGRSYEHRKEWIVERLTELSELFAVDLCSYAVMSNHTHLVLRLDPETAEEWSEEEIMERWDRLFSLPVLVQRYRRAQTTSRAESEAAQKKIEAWRERLSDLSWFMRCLNEPIARQANAEDGCTGRFWEGRFKSQALLDEAALLTCMAYVDLNPIRAAIARTPEQSDFTAIQQRIREVMALKDRKPPENGPRLLDFAGDERWNGPDGLPFSLDDYIELVDWSGRIVREGKRGAIPEDLPPILDRLEIDARTWLRAIRRGQRLQFHHAVGRASAIKVAAEHFGRSFLKGLGFARTLFPEPG
ncbi:transposase [Gammaproteobacteria bacterium AB-CW1]|uniref:Transposase n=1 Tax=Natronospira elongata TaxID=3110268 RepID=A0AAP6MKX4_9GAMM|nr:transposase [Gammaproteobacteria bacterium AB-CW1]